MEGIDWGVVIAAIALIFSVYTFRKTQNLAEKQASLVDDQKRLNELLVAREEKAAVSEKRAELSANLIRLGGVKNKVRVFNKGTATARNVEISFPEGNELVMKSEVEDKFPLELLEPHQSVDLIAVIHLSSSRKHMIV